MIKYVWIFVAHLNTQNIDMFVEGSPAFTTEQACNYVITDKTKLRCIKIKLLDIDDRVLK